MNKNQNTETYFAGSENRKSFLTSLQRMFAQGGMLNLVIFQYSNTYHEKLQIIYANIRV